MATASRILIVENNAPFRAALRQLLSQETDLQVVGEACNMREAIDSVESLAPNLVLTDLRMSDAHGIEAVAEMKRHYPDVKVVVISFHSENEYRDQCREAGAAGYVAKDAVHDELRDGIRTVLSGRTYPAADAPAEMAFACVDC
jgi:DNA-binding NarL/FixJ family response regulator